jgi:hypothetical protein
MGLKELISSLSKKSKYYESDFFPKKRLKKSEGRFELLGLSILDVYKHDANKLWYEVAPKLREKDIISVRYLKNNSKQSIKSALEEAGYKRGNLTYEFADRLKQLAVKIEKKPFVGDVSNLFKSYKKHNRETIELILKELRKIKGIKQKVSTMFLKFMISTFNQWKWNGDETSLFGIAAANDSHVRKVYTRFRGKKINDFENDLAKFSRKFQLSFIEIDNVFWNVGRIFCRNSPPSCHYCPLEPFCKFADVRKRGKRNKMLEINSYIK